MKLDTRFVMYVGLALVALALGAFALIKVTQPDAERGRDSGDKEVMVRKIQEERDNARQRLKLKRQQGKDRAAVKVSQPQMREKPELLRLEEEEEAKLNAFSRKILQDLQAALDSGDFDSVLKLVHKMLEIPPDPKFGQDGVATLLRRKAIEALGWFGGKSLPELTGLLADADPEIVQASFDQFTLALEDVTLSDYDRADIVVMASKVLTDTDHLEQLFMEINNMRHSVGAGALVQISLEGTPASQSLMPDAIEFFTGEDNIATVSDMENWLAENPDGEYDDDLYGGAEE